MTAKKYRSAVTGHFVTPEFAQEHPDTTVAHSDLTTREIALYEYRAGMIDKVRDWVRKHGASPDEIAGTQDNIRALLDIIDPQWREAVFEQEETEE